MPVSALVSDTRGLTLLELIIAFVVLQVAIMVFAQLFSAGLTLSRKAKQIEMAQILAQAKMEEIMRTLAAQAAPEASVGESGAPVFLRDRPSSFADFGSMHAEDTQPFMWLAEAIPSADTPRLFHVTLHVYMVEERPLLRRTLGAEEDFWLSENREEFTLIREAADGSPEVAQGKEKLRITSAVALAKE
ncbi:MAG: hypothetical protein C4532_00765 [Candidatus Abyssobacteria bacterium SURF_17]|uniref:Prepilin-type N-terminal cleavage/methylation domain-containing protein n=1 Tax=Candidatus Abyssobacteria bacterium SURF_17 TaxID=2093361 RepID=A0A419F9C7_9BACT|nr:MAG: hypothetical protein C4532_00765 [Candidatus Abyssubacteria bacterium SURF_17]